MEEELDAEELEELSEEDSELCCELSSLLCSELDSELLEKDSLEEDSSGELSDEEGSGSGSLSWLDSLEEGEDETSGEETSEEEICEKEMSLEGIVKSDDSEGRTGSPAQATRAARERIKIPRTGFMHLSLWFLRAR